MGQKPPGVDVNRPLAGDQGRYPAGRHEPADRARICEGFTDRHPPSPPPLPVGGRRGPPARGRSRAQPLRQRQAWRQPPPALEAQKPQEHHQQRPQHRDAAQGEQQEQPYHQARIGPEQGRQQEPEAHGRRLSNQEGDKHDQPSSARAQLTPEPQSHARKPTADERHSRTGSAGVGSYQLQTSEVERLQSGSRLRGSAADPRHLVKKAPQTSRGAKKGESLTKRHESRHRGKGKVKGQVKGQVKDARLRLPVASSRRS